MVAVIGLLGRYEAREKVFDIWFAVQRLRAVVLVFFILLLIRSACLLEERNMLEVHDLRYAPQPFR